jgi:hypothetical protein
MHTPSPDDVPSEQTVEVLSDHFLLAGLNSPAAWMYCPTRVTEQKLGYDGSLQNGKILIIQYKRVHVNAGGSLRVSINQAQHTTLRKVFHSGGIPYVFYGFSVYQSYQKLNDGFHVAGAPHFFANMRFVNLHDLPIACNSLSHKPEGTVCPVVMREPQTEVSSIDGNLLVKGLLQCSIGMELTEFVHFPLSWQQRRTPHTSILMFAT